MIFSTDRQDALLFHKHEVRMRTVFFFSHLFSFTPGIFQNNYFSTHTILVVTTDFMLFPRAHQIETTNGNSWRTTLCVAFQRRRTSNQISATTWIRSEIYKIVSTTATRRRRKKIVIQLATVHNPLLQSPKKSNKCRRVQACTLYEPQTRSEQPEWPKNVKTKKGQKQPFILRMYLIIIFCFFICMLGQYYVSDPFARSLHTVASNRRLLPCHRSKDERRRRLSFFFVHLKFTNKIFPSLACDFFLCALHENAHTAQTLHINI